MPIIPGANANILEAVGHTPLVRLNYLGKHTAAEIYVKCEYLNPGGSIKDRIAINIIN
ncbi:MAG TPA: pyridoxal-phosphate dependent enzyme, partial [Flavobacteriales bacterium]|nr:pyridoxal-phosphate dependent enzyme [Flavobacteriales bacterium]